MPFLPTPEAMDLRRISTGRVPRVVAVVAVAVVATAGVTWAASQGLPQVGSVPSVTNAAPLTPLVVPDVRRQAFVFAKGTLEDDGFAWRVDGSVHGYAANTVVAQSPAPGTKVADTGAPPVTLTLARNGKYGQKGEAQDASPYAATALQPAELASAVGPALPAITTAKTPAAATPETSAKPAAPKATNVVKKATTPSAWPQTRPPAFVVAGAKTEPLDEMPLPDRAQALGRWLDSHPTPTNANVKYWLYQNAWVVVGAKLGWWHGAQALQTLIAVDARTKKLWQIGSQSESAARQALSYVTSRSKPTR
jgi:hypothetical protein